MPRTLSDSEIDAFRTRLCRAAEKRFARHGVEGVTLRQLARDLGCSAMTPYRYFRDKDEIVAAVRTAALDRFAETLELAAKTKGNARQRGRAVGQAYIRFALENPDSYRLMYDPMQPDAARFPDLARAQARSRRTMSAYVEDLVAEGELQGDPEILGHIFWATVHGLVSLKLVNRLGENVDFDDLYRTAMRLLAQGAREKRATQPQSTTKQARRRA